LGESSTAFILKNSEQGFGKNSELRSGWKRMVLFVVGWDRRPRLVHSTLRSSSLPQTVSSQFQYRRDRRDQPMPEALLSKYPWQL